MDQIWMTCAPINRTGRPLTEARPPSVASLQRLGGVALLASVVLFAGCAVTRETRQSLAGYVQAMDQVELSANLFLTDFSNGLKAQEDFKRGAGSGEVPVRVEYPSEFVPPGDLGVLQTEPEKAVARTRQALVVIRQYNDALVALAEGHSEQEVRARVVEFGGALGKLASIVGSSIPGLGEFTALGPQIIKLAQDAANREQFIQAVNAGRKPVGDILMDLEDQTPAMYRVSLVGTKQGQTKVQNDIRRAASTLKALIARHGPPIDADLARKVAALQAELGDIGKRTQTLGAMPIPFPYTNGRPPFDTTAHAETEIFVQALRASAQQYAELVARQSAYYDLLNKYVAMLRQTRSSLDLMAASLAKPVDLRATIDGLFKAVFELRDGIAAYRNPSLTPAAP